MAIILDGTLGIIMTDDASTVKAEQVIISSVTGEPPVIVESTTMVANLRPEWAANLVTPNWIVSEKSGNLVFSTGGAVKTTIDQNGMIITSEPSGTLWTWGYNYFGQLGDNTTTGKSSPVQTIAAGTDWKQVAGGLYHTAAIKTDGTLWTWGYNHLGYNYYGQLGDNTNTGKSSPVQTISGGTNWKQVACGSTHTAAIKTDGTLWTWGWGSWGNLGDKTTTNRSSPVQTISAGTNWKQVACGDRHTVAIRDDSADPLNWSTGL